MRIFPRVMELLGLSIDPTWVKLVDFEGTKDLSLLARFAAQPLLGEDRGEFVMLDRPVTRFLVVTDAENRYATPASRERQRRLLLASITKDLPENLRHDFVGQDARMVEFFTWGRLPFEFEHFTNRQLADALISLAPDAYLRGRGALIAQVERIRHARHPDVDRIWPAAGIRNLKLALADELWPVLQRRIERAITRGTSGPPVMRAAVLAYELAMRTYRRNMSVQRYGGDAST
jgi:hypothetical protein